MLMAHIILPNVETFPFIIGLKRIWLSQFPQGSLDFMHRTFYTLTFLNFICKYSAFQIEILRNLVEAEGIQGLSSIANDHKTLILYKFISIYEKHTKNMDSLLSTQTLFHKRYEVFMRLFCICKNYM